MLREKRANYDWNAQRENVRTLITFTDSKYVNPASILLRSAIHQPTVLS